MDEGGHNKSKKKIKSAVENLRAQILDVLLAFEPSQNGSVAAWESIASDRSYQRAIETELGIALFKWPSTSWDLSLRFLTFISTLLNLHLGLCDILAPKKI